MHLRIRNITVGLFNDVANFSWCCFFTLWLFSWKMWCKNLASNKIFLRSFTMRSNSNNTSNLHGLVFSWKCDWFYFVQQNFWWTKIWKKNRPHVKKNHPKKKSWHNFSRVHCQLAPPPPNSMLGTLTVVSRRPSGDALGLLEINIESGGGGDLSTCDFLKLLLLHIERP